MCKKLSIPGVDGALSAVEDADAKRVREYLEKIDSNQAGEPLPPQPEQLATTNSRISELPSSQETVSLPTRLASPESSISLCSALAIDALYVQVAELGAIVESLTLKILDTSENGPFFRNESMFCDLIDATFEADVFVSLTANDLHSARIIRNRVVHRGNGSFPNDRELRKSRNSFTLALLDLLEYCGEGLKSEVLSEFKQYFPQNKRMRARS